MQGDDFDETRASARLLHLQIDMVHRHMRDETTEQLSITARVVPSLQAFGEFIERINLFQSWARLTQAMWLPWLDAMARAWPPALFDRSAPAPSASSDVDR